MRPGAATAVVRGGGGRYAAGPDGRAGTAVRARCVRAG
ncbi:hypothetical protein GZL_03177 [Streptomyces sp. 769]|nr:hypothetical protein GZL_03177 [Streptomyces sp. 769]